MAEVILISDDEAGVAATVADTLSRRGRRVVLVRACDDPRVTQQGNVFSGPVTDQGLAADLVRAVRETVGPIAALIHLLPLRGGPPFDELDLRGWRARVALDVKSLFYLLKAAGNDLRDGSLAGRTVLACTAMGGACGDPPADPWFQPSHGGVAGLVKTLALEWPDVRCRVVDTDPAEGRDRVAANITAEFDAREGPVELGYQNGRRVVLHPLRAPAQPGAGIQKVDSRWVFLVTGGARGITAEVAAEIATRYRPVLVLIGRSPLPADREPEATAGFSSAAMLKRALIDALRRQGRPVELRQVEEAYASLVRDREIRRNLSALRQAGATVAYHQVDVRDEVAFGQLLDDLYANHGRIDAVIHGAGTIEDALLQHKSPEAFDRVFDTKVVSAFILARKLRPESLKILMLFSSVAGRFGNRGQSDYAAASEVLNKLARHLDRRWPARVVSINWGPWAGAGMVSPELERQFAERGVPAIGVLPGRLAFDRELSQGQKGEVEIIIGRGPWETVASVAGSATGKTLALLGRMELVVEPGGAAHASYWLDPKHDRYLLDHQIDSRPVLPAVMAMELMAEAAQAAWPGSTVTALRDFRVLKGVVLDSGARRLGISLQPLAEAAKRSTDSIDLQVTIHVPDREEQVFYRALLHLDDRLPPAPDFDPPRLDDAPPFPLTVPEVYAGWLFHGPCFQSITDLLTVAPGGMVAGAMAVSMERCLADAGAGGWLIDPTVADSGPQLAWIWARAFKAMSALPARFELYERFGSLSSGPVRCYFELLGDADDDAVTANVTMTDRQGAVLGKLHGLESTCSATLHQLVGASAPATR